MRNPAAQAVIPPHSVEHPRLIATDADWQHMLSRRETDPDLDKLITVLIERAHKDLALAPLERKLEGRRLLWVSREFIRRSLLWSFAYRITHDPAYLERARTEMLNIAGFSDWHPDHYLDVAEMTTGMALGYDWLYHDLAPGVRYTLRQAIIDKGIGQARYGHPTFKLDNNWGQVCMAGMVLGALAIAEDEPALARDVLSAAKPDAFTALKAYRPDGVYPEGPSYWVYGTSYEALLVAALRSSGQADWGLMDAPGLKASAYFYAQALGPSGRQFNFSDASEGQELAPPLFFLAKELRQPILIEAKRKMIRNKQGLSERFAPLIALWWPENASGPIAPLHFVGQGPQPVAIWRSSWSDPDALYFAIKGGGAHYNHAHMDAGSFVLDLDGVRWAKDLGMQDYNSLESRGIDLWNGKQDSARWKVFRIGSASANSITVDNSLHNASGMAMLQPLSDSEALIDLSPVFLPGQVQSATRRVRVSADTVQLSDTVQLKKPSAQIRWTMNTEAAIEIDGNQAVLRSGGKTLHIRFSGTPVSLSVLDIASPPHDYDAANPNTRQLIASSQMLHGGSWEIVVQFSRD